jgi:DNA-directed RNA polymerase subunit alpha
MHDTSLFKIMPLQPGEATALGQVLRQALLSSTSGIAILGFRLEGENKGSELMVIPGLREDGQRFIINLKSVVLKGRLRRPHRCKVCIKGPRCIRINDFNLPHGVMAVEPSQHIATIEKVISFEIELLIGEGQGYKESRTPLGPPDFVSIESRFAPIRRVIFNIIPANVPNFSKLLSYEALLMLVTTNGSVSAYQELKRCFQKISAAAQTIRLSFEESLSSPSNVHEKVITYNDAKHGDTAIISIGLGKRCENALLGEEILTVGDLLRYKNQRKLLQIKGLGPASLDKIRQVLWDLYHIEIMA